LVVVLFVLPVVAGCDGDGGEGGSTTTPAPTDLSGELITASDLPGDWDTPGPHPIPRPEDEVSTTLGPMCPDGETATLDDAESIVLAAGNATIRLSSLEERQLEVEELLFHDDEGALFEALSLVFESCVGSPFVLEGDPDETIQWEPLDITLPAEDAVALLERWGTGGELDGGENGYVLVNVDTVTMMLSVVSDGTTEPYDDELLTTAATAAIDRLTDDVRPPTMTPATTDAFTPATTTPDEAQPSDTSVPPATELVLGIGVGGLVWEGEAVNTDLPQPVYEADGVTSRISAVYLAYPGPENDLTYDCADWIEFVAEVDGTRPETQCIYVAWSFDVSADAPGEVQLIPGRMTTAAGGYIDPSDNADFVTGTPGTVDNTFGLHYVGGETGADVRWKTGSDEVGFTTHRYTIPTDLLQVYVPENEW
jgi:hypothetical protein